MTLLILSLVAWAIGFSTLTQSADPHGFFWNSLPQHMHGAVWFIGGTIGILHSFKLRPGSDTWGFIALVALAVFRSFLYFWSWLESLIFRSSSADSGDWLGAAVWAAITVLIMTIAGWPEPHPKTVEELKK